jgi:hypothetical protein
MNWKNLSFVECRENSVDTWEVKRTGIFIADTAIGRNYADDLILEMARSGNTAALGHVFQGMLAKGVYGAIEIGFCQRIADRATDCAMQRLTEHLPVRTSGTDLPGISARAS